MSPVPVMSPVQCAQVRHLPPQSRCSLSTSSRWMSTPRTSIASVIPTISHRLDAHWDREFSALLVPCGLAASIRVVDGVSSIAETVDLDAFVNEQERDLDSWVVRCAFLNWSRLSFASEQNQATG